MRTPLRFERMDLFLALGSACLMLGGCTAADPTKPQIIWATPAAIIYGTPLSSTQLDATTSADGTFTYNPAPGAVLEAGPHTLSVAFTPANTANYTSATASVTITVNPLTPTLSWSAPNAIAVGTPLSAAQLDATASVPGDFVYNPAAGTVLTAGSQKLSVTFTPSDANYAATTGVQTISVVQDGSELSWATPAPIPYSTPLGPAQLDATATIPGTFIYNPPAGTILNIGSYTLSVNFTPDDTAHYTSASATVAANVVKATPQIVWEPQDPIIVGIGLTPSQLDAVAVTPDGQTQIAGDLVYSPGVGTVFGALGEQTLNVNFTPNNTTDYSTAHASISDKVVSSFSVVAWGDSYTEGEEGLYDTGNYPSELQSLIVLPVINEGVNGQTSNEIGVREGAIPTYATVAGGVIPASGGVTVTFPTGYEPVTDQGPVSGVAGTILGVHGVVTLNLELYTFTRTTAGSAVTASGSPQFVVDTPYAKDLPVFWEGRDDFANPSLIASNMAAEVATVPSGQDYAVLSLINFNRQEEWIGGDSYGYLLKDNAELAATYGSHYVDVWTVLINSYNPALVTDVSDYQHGEVPTSLRAVFIQSATLMSAIGPADTTVTISTSEVPYFLVGAILTIDTGANAENVSITAVNGNTLTVQRNFGGNDTSHAAGAPVVESDFVHLNAQGYQIVANTVAQYLSAYQR